MGTSCIILAQYHNQEIGTNAIHWLHADFTVLHAPVYVHSIIWCADSCDQHHSEDAEQSHRRDPSGCLCTATAPSFPPWHPSSLETTHLFSVSVFWSFKNVIQMESYSLNSLRLAFFMQHDSLEILPSVGGGCGECDHQLTCGLELGNWRLLPACLLLGMFVLPTVPTLGAASWM